MKIGLVFPQTEFGNDPIALRDYARTAESLGFSHIMAYDHVVGANPDRPGGWRGPYTHQSAFHEPFVLFSYMAALTTKLAFITGIIILPQRETALVAKQAASLDVVSNGRFRLGIGVGWNKVEMEALGFDFHNRGKRIEEQIDVLKLLFTQELVTFKGNWHTLPDVGLNPLPMQRPIPIWLGGHSDAVLRRLARKGDGWLPGYRTAEAARPSLDKIAAYLAEYGRSHQEIGLEPRLHYGDGPEAWQSNLQGWQAAGATHISFNSMGVGFDTPQKHLQAIEAFAKTVGL
ncbi:LLM class F420-dependent oxidoreductase [Candidatus Leptofilum sp.]|uniref:LLM class F420-dependent oxidoreductase n=1 Tax=Candidatus Leptofilum sp. TaxID=3241576 RepID=UPI003B59BD7C